MTAVLTQPVHADGQTWTIGAPRLLAGVTDHGALDLGAHLTVHGAMPGSDLGKLLSYLDSSGIAGRGGAGFPLATKLRALSGGRRRVIVNGSESEPASFKDRVLMRRTPHLVLDGALAVAAAVGTRDLTIAVHDAQSAAALRAAIAQRGDAKRVRVATVAGGFVAGEARALVRALAGGPAVPPGRRTHLTSKGVIVSNVETFAQVAVLLRLGPRRFAETGTHDEPGTTLLTVGGAVDRPGVVEIPLGTPLGIVLSAAGAASTHAVVLGGYHGSWVEPNPAMPLSRAGVAAAGGSFGAGVLLVLDDATCHLGELARVAGWLAGESAKQCGPCRFGLPALAADVQALAAGNTAALSNAFRHAHAVDGRGACAHPDGAARFVTTGLHLLRDEVERHLTHGGCGRPVLGRLNIAGAR
jgi:NADH:ubiquinone oxidoreductase subunit F (NADH-binding)